VKIFTAANPTEAHIVYELLKFEDITTEVRGVALFGLKGEIPMTTDTDPYLWLFDHTQLPKAKVIIEEFESQDTSLADWSCSHCDEINEGQFSACWQCGHSIPD